MANRIVTEQQSDVLYSNRNRPSHADPAFRNVQRELNSQQQSDVVNRNGKRPALDDPNSGNAAIQRWLDQAPSAGPSKSSGRSQSNTVEQQKLQLELEEVELQLRQNRLRRQLLELQ